CMRPISNGGIAEALGEMALWSGMGAKIKPGVPTIEIFSGAPGRMVVGVLPHNAKSFESRIPTELFTQLGTTGGKRMLCLPLEKLFGSRNKLANLREEVVEWEFILKPPNVKPEGGTCAGWYSTDRERSSWRL